MGMLKKVKGYFEAPDYDDDEDMMEETAEAPQKTTASPAAVPVAPRVQAAKGIGYAAMPARQSKPYTMVVVSPKNYKDAEKIGAHLKESRPVVINLEKTDKGEAERIVDFVNGVMYALEGNIDKISEGIYLCAPSNMSVDRENYAAYTAPAPGAEGSDDAPQWKVPQA